jgi:hypothetical protein
MSKEIKISSAKQIANEYDYDMVIIIGINNDSSGHVTTYGKNKGFCKIAGHIGQKELAPKIFSMNGILANLDFDEIK